VGPRERRESRRRLIQEVAARAEFTNAKHGGHLWER
jgi:hypothetical protein